MIGNQDKKKIINKTEECVDDCRDSTQYEWKML